MPGIDPAVLASIGSSKQAYPGSPSSPVSTTEPDGDEDQAEPVRLHDAITAICAAVKDVRSQLEDLVTDAEMAEEIDPAAEKAISQAAQLIGQVDDILAPAEQALGAQRADHESTMAGDMGDGSGPPPEAAA